MVGLGGYSRVSRSDGWVAMRMGSGRLTRRRWLGAAVIGALRVALPVRMTAIGMEGAVTDATVAVGQEMKGAAVKGLAPRAPELEYCFELLVQVDAPMDLGETQHGHRRIVPIAGGSFSGPKLEGVVVPGGADWQVIHPDGVVEIDTRYTLKTKDGALIYLRNAGLRYATPEVTARMAAGELVSPTQYYFRTSPVFETAAPGLQWMVHSLFVGVAERRPKDVSVQVWRVL